MKDYNKLFNYKINHIKIDNNIIIIWLINRCTDSQQIIINNINNNLNKK